MRWYVMPLLAVTFETNAAHPLITEDTGTQGRGRYQLELVTERGTDGADDARERTVSSAAVLSYGWTGTADVILTVPHERVAVAGTATRQGLGDLGVDIKWRFFEREALSFALRPGVTFPTADQSKVLGAGRTRYNAMAIASYAPEPWAVHAHVGLVHHRNVWDERGSLYHASVALTCAVGSLRWVADVGRDTPSDKNEDRSMEFLIIGAIYSLSSAMDFDVGYKKALSRPETDRALLAGITMRF